MFPIYSVKTEDTRSSTVESSSSNTTTLINIYFFYGWLRADFLTVGLSRIVKDFFAMFFAIVET